MRRMLLSRRTWGSALLAQCLAVAACSGPSGKSDASVDAPDEDTDACTPGQDGALDLIGTWAARSWIRVELVTSDDGIVRMCPSPHPGITYLTLLIDLASRNADRIEYEFVVCEIDMPRVRSAIVPCDMDEYVWVNLELGPQLASYITGQVFGGYALLGGDAPCSSYESHSMDVTYGFDSSIVGPDDPLPGWLMDCPVDSPSTCVTNWESVIDEEGDGNPGVSLQVTTEPTDTIRGHAYTTWRTNPHMSGTAVSNNLIQGDLAPTMEYDVVGSGADLQGLHMDEKTVKRNLPVFLLPGSGSTFKMVRVDGLHGGPDLDTNMDGTVDCEEVMSHLDIFE